MANLDAPSGLNPISTGKPGTVPSLHEYQLTAGVEVFQGQILTIVAGTGDTVLNEWDGSSAAVIAGVAAHYRGASDTDRKVLVYDDPDQFYVIQADDATTGNIVAESDITGSRFAVVNATAGDSDTLRSTMELDEDSGQAADAATHILIGVRSYVSPENDLTAANPRVIVKIDHLKMLPFGSATTGVA